MVRKIALLGLLIVAALLVQNSSAEPAEMLPASSYYQGFQWYNTVYLGEGVLGGRIDFAVYDTLGANGNEFVHAGFQTPGPGQYIYAYQIFNDALFSDLPVASFSILNLDGSAVDEALMTDTGAQDDGQGGISPAPSDTQGVWKWQLGTGGYVYKHDHSWFLVFSSDHHWTVGSFDITYPQEGSAPVPGDTPEPATIVLLGIGAAVLLRRPRKAF